LVNIDLQKAYTRTDLFKTAYETDPNQLHYVNDLAGRLSRTGLACCLDSRRLYGVRGGLWYLGHPH
jgi:hypothetical protein